MGLVREGWPSLCLVVHTSVNTRALLRTVYEGSRLCGWVWPMAIEEEASNVPAALFFTTAPIARGGEIHDPHPTQLHLLHPQSQPPRLESTC